MVLNSDEKFNGWIYFKKVYVVNGGINLAEILYFAIER
jgi:hypothetical protein